jgi:peptide/nickel transport system substrate-binding protein
VKSSRLVPILAAGMLLITVLSACSSGTKPGGSADSSARKQGVIMTPAATSDVDKVTWNLLTGEPITLDPFVSEDYSANPVSSNMCETLLVQKPDSSIAPNLAASYTNPDPLHWVYDLRTGVKFWNGKPMTADDVVWSMRHNMTYTPSFYNYLYANVKSVDATGPAQVTVTLSKPDYLFNTELASYAGVVVEKAFFEAHAKDFGSPKVGVECTGPFRFKNWAQGESITLVKNADYWNKSLQPKVGSLVFTFLTNESSITSALETGEIDGAYDLPFSGLAQLRTSSAGTVYEGQSPLSLTMQYANPRGAMSNLNLRQALQMAVDWNGVASEVLKGTGEPLRGMMPPTVFGYANAKLQPPYDALPAPKSAQYDKAKALVAAAGDDAKKEVLFAVPDIATYQAFGTAVADAASRIGMKLKLRVVPAAQYPNYLFDAKTRAGVDILLTDYWPNVSDPLDWYGNTSVGGSSYNFYGYTGIDALYNEARGTKDDATRSDILVKMQDKLNKDLLPMVPGVYHLNTLWMNKRITGAPASFSYVFYPWAATLGGK